MKQKIRLIIFGTLIMLYACNKNSTEEVQLTAHWKIDSLQLLTNVGGQQVFETFYRPANDYYFFKEDNKLYRHLFSVYDTIPYEKVTVDGQLFIKYAGRVTDTIKVLTKQSLIMTNPQGGITKFFFSR